MEETNSVVGMLSRACQSGRVCRSNFLLESARPFWRATKYNLGRSSVPSWHLNMRAARRQGLLGVFRCEIRSLSWVRDRTPPELTLCLVHPREKCGWGCWEKATNGEPALAASLWCMLYADDAGVVSRSSDQLREMMGVIVVVRATFGLAVSGAKTEIICLRTKGMPEYTAKRRGSCLDVQPYIRYRIVVVVVVVVVVSHIQRIGCQPEKLTLHGGQSRSWSAEQRKKEEKVWQRTTSGIECCFSTL